MECATEYITSSSETTKVKGSVDDESTTKEQECEDVIANAESPPAINKAKIQGPITTVVDDDDQSDVEEVFMPEEDMDSERTKRKAHMHTSQAVRWTANIHFRIQKLEKDFQTLRGDEEVTIGGLLNSKGPNHEPIIKRMTWDEFKPPRAAVKLNDTPSEKHSLRLDNRKRWVLEVLDHEPEQTARGHLSKMPSKGSKSRDGEGFAEGEATQHEPTPAAGSSSKAPARLRIRSKLLLAHLNDISNEELNTRPGKMVFLRPFKFFCVYEEEIRARHAELEAKFAHELDIKGVDAKQDRQPEKKPQASRRHPPKGSLDDQDISQGEKYSAKALQHFRLLKEFLDTDLKDLLQLRTSIGKKEVKKIAFQDLWHLFKHDQEVYVPGNEKDKSGIYRVFKYTGGRSILPASFGMPSNSLAEKLGPGSWSRAFGVQCWCLRFDGHVYRPQLKTFGIRPYEGEKEITSLPIYPLDHDPDHASTRESYIQNGKTVTRFCGPNALYMRYAGPNFDEGSRGEHVSAKQGRVEQELPGPDEFYPPQINSEVMIDFEQAFLDRYERPLAIDFEEDVVANDYRELDEVVTGNTHCKEEGCCTSDVFHLDFHIDNTVREKHFKHGYDSPALDVRNDIEADEDFVLLPSQVYGFVLKKQRWATLSTAQKCLREIESSKAWKDLVLDGNVKRLVEAQVTQHIERVDEEKKEGKGVDFGEFISGKGRSLVILLHGPPGVGKTSTAECIADHVRKPLYSLTSGNLGVDPDTVEQKLETHFNLASKWGCILLLDEADVFLQQRKQAQLSINAIVSVFLRQLEYYSGVLFLTTNRLGDIDRAFKSRIHIALEYKRFSKSTSAKVYQLCLERLRGQYASRDRKLKIKDQDILDWARKHFKENRWNGREIFNACQTAIALAEWENKEQKEKKLVLRDKHFEMVAEASRGFEKYLSDLREDENVEAWKTKTRIDDEKFRGAIPQGSFMFTPTPAAKKKNGRKPQIDDDDDDDDDDDGALRKMDKRGTKTRREDTDDDSSSSD